MAESTRRQLEFIARLTYTLPGLSGKLRLYFSQFLHFHFSQSLSRDLIQHTENRRASKGFSSDEKITEFTSPLSAVEKVWCVGVVSLFRNLASEAGDRIATEKLGHLVTRLSELFQIDTVAVDASRLLIEKEIERFRNRPLIRIPVSIWPMVLDFTLRSIVITIIRPGATFLAIANILVIPAMILLLVAVKHRRDRKHNGNLLMKYGQIHEFRIEPHVSIANYSWLAAFIGLGVYIAYLLTVPLHGLAFIGLTLYYFIYLRFFYVGRLTENGLAAQVIEARREKADYDYDTNDEEIVRLETRLNASTSRLEAYVLESALFGALTFSGFLQIMASDLVSFASLENFANSTFDISRALINFDWVAYDTSLSRIADKVSLLCLVSVESLLCSIFFLAVIASRLRFSDVADSVRTAINMAKTYNDKEEVLAGESSRDTDRFVKLTARINQQLHVANEALDRTNPIILYMQYFRNAGILMFLVILITSSLFITGVLGWTFLGLVLATFLYFNYARISESFRAAYLTLRIQLARNGHWVAVGAIAPLIFAQISKGTILWPYSDELNALAMIIVGVYVFTWITIVAHVDEEFGDIENRVGTWRWIKSILAILCLGFALSLAMKQVSLSGADELILIFFSLLSISMYFVGYFLTRIRWLGIICGCILAIAFIGTEFKILHLNGANELILFGFVALLTLTPIITWKRKVFHSLFIRFVVAVQIMTLVMITGISQRAELMIAHSEWNVEKIQNVMESNWPEALMDGDLNESMRTSDWYIETYGAAPGYIVLYRELQRMYYFTCETLIREHPNDRPKLERALRISRQMQKISDMFPGVTFSRMIDAYCYEALALHSLGETDKALEVIDNLLDRNLGPSGKDYVMSVRSEIAH